MVVFKQQKLNVLFFVGFSTNQWAFYTIKGFQKIFLKKGEAKTVTFYITTNDLKFCNNNLQWVYEPGDFTVFVGGSSADTKAASFAVEK